MTTEPIVEPQPAEGLDSSVTDEQLIGVLVDRARGAGLKLTGEGGLLQKLTKRVLESALEGEITDHVGYDKHDPEGRGSGNSRNGHRAKTVLTDSARSRCGYRGTWPARSNRTSYASGSVG